jgi:hypothetical protein
MSLIHKIKYKITTILHNKHAETNHNVFHAKNKFENYHKEILPELDGNLLIKQALSESKPFLAGKIGFTELSCLNNYIFNQINSKPDWKQDVRENIHNQAGVFPTDENTLDKFSEIYLDAIKQMDLGAIWNNKGESFYYKTYCQEVSLCQLRSLEPYYHDIPWSVNLKDKNILVVHPFEESIQTQYLQRKKLFKQNILPDFNLITIKPPQTLGQNTNNFKNWIEGFDNTTQKINTLDFDIAIIGAGAYGLPIGAFIKKMGKQAIHMGGATQVLFGIKGKRWDNHAVIGQLYNDFWVKPNLNETPPNSKNVEDGCYW